MLMYISINDSTLSRDPSTHAHIRKMLCRESAEMLLEQKFPCIDDIYKASCCTSQGNDF